MKTNDRKIKILLSPLALCLVMGVFAPTSGEAQSFASGMAYSPMGQISATGGWGGSLGMGGMGQMSGCAGGGIGGFPSMGGATSPAFSLASNGVGRSGSSSSRSTQNSKLDRKEKQREDLEQKIDDLKEDLREPKAVLGDHFKSEAANKVLNRLRNGGEERTQDCSDNNLKRNLGVDEEACEEAIGTLSDGYKKLKKLEKDLKAVERDIEREEDREEGGPTSRADSEGGLCEECERGQGASRWGSVLGNTALGALAMYFGNQQNLQLIKANAALGAPTYNTTPGFMYGMGYFGAAVNSALGGANGATWGNNCGGGFNMANSWSGGSGWSGASGLSSSIFGNSFLPYTQPYGSTIGSSYGTGWGYSTGGFVNAASTNVANISTGGIPIRNVFGSPMNTVTPINSYNLNGVNSLTSGTYSR